MLINDLTSADTVKGNCQENKDEPLCYLQSFVQNAKEVSAKDDEATDNTYVLISEDVAYSCDNATYISRFLRKILKH